MICPNCGYESIEGEFYYIETTKARRNSEEYLPRYEKTKIDICGCPLCKMVFFEEH